MPVLLGDYRVNLRLDLSDPASATNRFTDADLNRAVELARQAYELALPRRRRSTLLTVSGSRDVSLSALTGLISVLDVEYPTGQWPEKHPPFRVSFDQATLTLIVDAAPGANENVNVVWGSVHTLDAVTSTILAEHERLLHRGAYGYACSAYGTPASDNFRYQDGAQATTVDQQQVPREWRARSTLALNAFLLELGALAARRRAGEIPFSSVVWSKLRPAARWPVAPETEP